MTSSYRTCIIGHVFVNILTKVNALHKINNLNNIISAVNRNNLKGTLIVGGGISYRSKQYERTEPNDIDAMFVFPTRHSLQVFLYKNTSKGIERKLGFDKNSANNFGKADFTWFLENNIEILRFAGTVLGAKTTVKLTDEEFIQTAIDGGYSRVFSKTKDRRIFERKNIFGETIKEYLINKMLDDTDNYVILDKTYSYDNINRVVPGLFTDFFITSTILCGTTTSSLMNLQRRYQLNLIQKVKQNNTIEKNCDWSKFLIRGERFSDSYKENLNNTFEKLAEGLPHQKTDNHINKKATSEDIVLVDTRLFQSKVKAKLEPNRIMKSIPVQNMEAALGKGLQTINSKNLLQWKYFIDTQFSTNCHAGYCLDELGNKYCFKTIKKENPESVSAEILQSKNLSNFYHNYQKPIYVNPEKNLILYRWISDEHLAKHLNDSKYYEEYIRLELNRAEELLQGYISSLSAVNSSSTLNQNIHRLYHERVAGERLGQYYKSATFTLGASKIPFSQLIRLKPIINGYEYTDLHQIIEYAVQYLNPQFLDDKCKIYGFGDCHAGNVLITSNGYTTIDYEYAGIHSPFIDLSKTLYIDSYAETLYNNSNFITSEFTIEAKIDGSNLIITHDYQLPQLAEDLLNIKMKGILFPTLEEAKKKGFNTQDWEEILKSAMFVASFLCKNITEYREKYFLLALTQSIMLGTHLRNLDKNAIKDSYFNKILYEYAGRK